PARTSPPSRRLGSGSRAPAPRRRCTTRRPPPPAPPPPCRPGCTPAYWLSARLWLENLSHLSPSPCRCYTSYPLSARKGLVLARLAGQIPDRPIPSVMALLPGSPPSQLMAYARP